MENRAKLLLRFDLIRYASSLGKLLIGAIVFFIILLNLLSMVSNYNFFDLSSVFSNSIAITMLIFFIQLVFDFDNSFQGKLQNGFARKQIFKNDMCLIGSITFCLTIIDKLFEQNLFDNPYNGFFQNSVANLMALFLLAFIGNCFIFLVGEFLGALFNLFSKKIRKWVGIILILGFSFLSTVGLISLVRGAYQLVSYHVIDEETLRNFVNGTISILLGAQSTGAWNPINMIVTLLILTSLLAWLTRFIILRLQLHRN